VRLSRLFRHTVASHWRTRLKFPARTLDAIEQAIGRVEAVHSGEIRFAVETSLTPLHVFNEVEPRVRALEVFSHLRVWDTEGNNGVLIYVEMADRSVEIVADRGFDGRVSAAEWQAVCRMMEGHYRAGDFQNGSIAGVDAIGTLLARHFPAADPRPAKAHNQLPDRPTLL
jgi:uncharacterized membrane protein